MIKEIALNTRSIKHIHRIILALPIVIPDGESEGLAAGSGLLFVTKKMHLDGKIIDQNDITYLNKTYHLYRSRSSAQNMNNVMSQSSCMSG